MKKVMVFGTFAILHPGHLYFLKEAKKCGNQLLVVIARDVNVKKIKGFFPKLNERGRFALVSALKIVDKAILGDKVNWYKVIVKYKPDVICLGYDQREPKNFYHELKSRGVDTKVIRLRPYKPKQYKSSILLNS